MEQNRTKTNKNYYLETEIHPGSAAWKATLKGFPKLKEQFLRENLSFSIRLKSARAFCPYNALLYPSIS